MNRVFKKMAVNKKIQGYFGDFGSNGHPDLSTNDQKKFKKDHVHLVLSACFFQILRVFFAEILPDSLS